MVRRGNLKTDRRRRRRGGNMLVEVALAFLPFLVMNFAIMDMAYVFYVHNTLQNAVREGSRYATTYQVQAGLGQVDSVQRVVQQFSMGLLTTAQLDTYVFVRFYNPVTLVQVSGAGSNSPGNVVEVSVESFAHNWLMPLQRNGAAWSLTTRSASRLEPLPPGQAPPTL